MKIIIAGVVLLCVGVACAERTFPQRSLAARAASLGGNQPHWFIESPRKSSNSFQSVQVPLSDNYGDEDDDEFEDNNYAQGFVVQDDDDDDSSKDDHRKNKNNCKKDDDDDESGEMTGNVVGIISLNEANDMIQKDEDDDSTAIGERDDDDDDADDDVEENEESAGVTGSTIYLPRRVLHDVPEGAIVAVVDESEGRAVKKYYRRVRRGKPQRRRRRGNKQRRRRRGGNRRRRRPNIRVIRRGGNRGNNQRRRPNVIRL